MSQELTDVAVAAYMLGMRVADAIRDVDGQAERFGQMLVTLRAVAQGELTMIGGPEESARALGIPLETAHAVAPMLRADREQERRAAQLVWEKMASEIVEALGDDLPGGPEQG